MLGRDIILYAVRKQRIGMTSSPSVLAGTLDLKNPDRAKGISESERKRGGGEFWG